MQVSKRFLAILEQQLAQFADRPDLQSIVVYAALPQPEGSPSLVAIGCWPRVPALNPQEPPAAEPALGEARRWLALRDGPLLLGAIRVDAEHWPWPTSLTERLEATARCLTEALRLNLEQERLGRELARRDDQLKLLVHQLRNPLAALRTFAQLLRRRLDGDATNSGLVDNLLIEQAQLNRYVEAIEALEAWPRLASGDGTSALLLPPALHSDDPQALRHELRPLLERAQATAQLQGRLWDGPDAQQIPDWRGDTGAVAEIVANLLENAFRYSHNGGAIGLLCQREHQAAPAGNPSILIAVWDSGPEIPADERERIFGKGERGSQGQGQPGSGLGLALARTLAQQLGGSLELMAPPQALDPNNPELPNCGNAFCLRLPIPAMDGL